MAARACIEAARTRDDLADIVNAGIEELLRCRRELPAFDALLRLARSARTLVNRGYHRQVATALIPEARIGLATLLVVPAGATRSGWDQVKADPPRPSPQRMREHLAHLAWLRGQPWQQKRSQACRIASYASSQPRRARLVLPPWLSHVTAKASALALMATLLRSQVARALDDAAEMFVRLTTRMHSRAREALDEHRARQAAETDALVALLRQTVLACQDQGGKPDARLSRGRGFAVTARCRRDPGEVRGPRGVRRATTTCRCSTRFSIAPSGRHSYVFWPHAAPVSTSQDRGHRTDRSAFLMAHRTDRRAKLQTAVEAKAGGRRHRSQGPLDLSWVEREMVAAADWAHGARTGARRGRPAPLRDLPVHPGGQRTEVGRPLHPGQRRLRRLPRPARVLGGVQPRRRRLRRCRPASRPTPAHSSRR